MANENKPMDDDEFYVGYLPMPPALKRRIQFLVVGMLVALILSGALLAGAMRPAGDGNWDTDHITTLEGTLTTSPYPIITTRDAKRNSESFVLIEEGKFGARGSINAMVGKSVRAKGHLLTRGNRRLLELLPDTDAVEAIGESAPPDHSSTSARAVVTFVGEIIDPKCFAGAMKPGDQKTHKGCAVLCLRGGIPPMFAVWNRDGHAMTYLLVDVDGKPLVGERLEAVIPFVGDLIEAKGTVIQTESGPVFQMDAGSIRRL